MHITQVQVLLRQDLSSSTAQRTPLPTAARYG